MKPSVSHILVAAAVLSLAACSKNDPSSDQIQQNATQVTSGGIKQPGDGYTLRATDRLHIEMFMDMDLKGDYDVSPEGDLELPLIDRTRVAGKTLKEVRQILTEKYKKYYREPSFNSLYILRYSERKVYIDGFVNRAGAVIFPPEENMTISRAIAGAGGIQARGARNDVKITRTVNGKIQVYTLDMDEVSSGRAPDMELQENDRVYVRDSNI